MKVVLYGVHGSFIFNSNYSSHFDTSSIVLLLYFAFYVLRRTESLVSYDGTKEYIWYRTARKLLENFVMASDLALIINHSYIYLKK